MWQARQTARCRLSPSRVTRRITRASLARATGERNVAERGAASASAEARRVGITARFRARLPSRRRAASHGSLLGGHRAAALAFGAPTTTTHAAVLVGPPTDTDAAGHVISGNYTAAEAPPAAHAYFGFFLALRSALASALSPPHAPPASFAGRKCPVASGRGGGAGGMSSRAPRPASVPTTRPRTERPALTNTYDALPRYAPISSLGGTFSPAEGSCPAASGPAWLCPPPRGASHKRFSAHVLDYRWT